MKKITEYSYVNVAGWTEEEVQQVAEIFSNVLDCDFGDIEVVEDLGYIWLYKMNHTDKIWVNNKPPKDRGEELTKEEVFSAGKIEEEEEGSSSNTEVQDLAKEYDVEITFHPNDEIHVIGAIGIRTAILNTGKSVGNLEESLKSLKKVQESVVEIF